MTGDGFVWDDKTWDHVWERVLNPVERHHIAVSVVRRRVPEDPFERRIAVELARRWQRHALFLASLYLLWSAFWAAIGFDSVTAFGASAARLPFGCAALGIAAVTGCLAFRRRITRFVVTGEGAPLSGRDPRLHARSGAYPAPRSAARFSPSRREGSA